MEKEILREMVMDRSKKIKMLRRKIKYHEERINSMAEELEQVSQSVAQQRLDHQQEVDMLVQARFVVENVLAKLGNDLHQQGPSLHRYTDVVKKQGSPKKSDSSYVVKMQAQLCKAMHTTGITDHYLKLVKTICETEMKYLDDARKQIVERMSNEELELLNLIVAKDQECRTLEASQNAELDAERIQILKIRNLLDREEDGCDQHDDDKEETLEETEETDEEDEEEEEEDDGQQEEKEQDIYVVTATEPYLQAKLIHSKQRVFLETIGEDDVEPVNSRSDC
jgi:hypothetical protein